MSLLDVYLNQSLTWTPAQRNTDGTAKKDGSGRVLYNSELQIKGLLNDKFQMIRDKTGAEVVSSGFAKVKVPAEIDDKINGRLVIGRNIHKDFDGQDEGWTVYLK
jgi:hypothetical protein